MGAQICKVEQIDKHDLVIQPVNKAKFHISGPPNLKQPVPIICSVSTPVSPVLEKEVYPPEEQQAEKPVDYKHLVNVHHSVDEVKGLLAKEQSNSEKNNEKGSSRSILKKKDRSGNNSPTSPNNANYNNDLDSQKSNKKVTFDKKQKVIYSSFRGQK